MICYHLPVLLVHVVISEFYTVFPISVKLKRLGHLASNYPLISLLIEFEKHMSMENHLEVDQRTHRFDRIIGYTIIAELYLNSLEHLLAYFQPFIALFGRTRAASLPVLLCSRQGRHLPHLRFTFLHT